MVTARYGYSSAPVYNPKLIPWGGYSSVFSPGCMVMTGCRKELAVRGGFLKYQEGIGKRVLASISVN